MKALKAALLNKDKPVTPFVILGFASLAAVYRVIMSWGEYRFKDQEMSTFETAFAACFLLYWVYEAWKYSQSLFRSPIVVLLVVSVLYDAWLFLSHAWVVVDFTQLAIEAGWACAVAVLYFDTIAVSPRQASGQ